MNPCSGPIRSIFAAKWGFIGSHRKEGLACINTNVPCQRKLEKISCERFQQDLTQLESLLFGFAEDLMIVFSFQ
jgi:hypothetical protein